MAMTFDQKPQHKMNFWITYLLFICRGTFEDNPFSGRYNFGMLHKERQMNCITSYLVRTFGIIFLILIDIVCR